ncbi:hypothetical protein [Moorena producens]|uniref:hypothetical protein n=1 Tax=Moorena producens TaxID=1155739 RepID=UPI003C757E30
MNKKAMALLASPLLRGTGGGSRRGLGGFIQNRASIAHLPISPNSPLFPCSLFPVPCSLFPVPYSRFPIPYSLN